MSEKPRPSAEPTGGHVTASADDDAQPVRASDRPEPHEGARQADTQREFLAFVSHELKNRLATITGYAQLMRRRGAYDEAAVDAILGQTRRVERLLNDLVDTAQADAGRLALRPGPTDLSAVVAAAVADAQAMTARHTVRDDLPADPVLGSWDADRLGQVLQNLLGNAVKYAPDDTEIVARLERCHDGNVCVSVVDQGPGVPPDMLPRLFDRFYRAPTAATEAPGLGLGLYVSRMLVEAHGGDIWAEPAGCGTCFRFTLPRRPPAQAPS